MSSAEPGKRLRVIPEPPERLPGMSAVSEPDFGLGQLGLCPVPLPLVADGAAARVQVVQVVLQRGSQEPEHPPGELGGLGAGEPPGVAAGSAGEDVAHYAGPASPGYDHGFPAVPPAVLPGVRVA